MPLIPRVKAVTGARHMGRKTTRYSFEVRDIFIESGVPANLSATGLVVQMSRGPKLAATKEAELTPELKESGGGIAFPGHLSFVATLFASKTGKSTGFSDKRYRVSVLALKPNFGSSKRSLKEVAACELNISDHAASEAPAALSLQLDRRQHDGLPVTLQLTISSKPVKAGADGDDDDDSDARSETCACLGADRTAPRVAHLLTSLPQHLGRRMGSVGARRGALRVLRGAPWGPCGGSPWGGAWMTIG
jgi:hypothetical protein